MNTLPQLAASSQVGHRYAPYAFCCLCMLGLVLAFPAPLVACLATLGAWAMAWGIARVPVKASMHLLAGPMLFLAFSLFTLSLSISQDGEGLHLRFASNQGDLLTHTGLRALSALSCTLALVLGVPMHRLFSLLARLGVPSNFLDFANLLYRAIFQLDSSRSSIALAQKNRLGDMGFKNRFRSLGLLAGTLFLHSHHQASRLELGLAARGYTGSLRTQASASPPAGKLPWLLAAGWLLILAFLGLMGVIHAF